MLAAGLLCGQRCTALRVVLGGVTAAAASLALLAPEAPTLPTLLYKAATAALTVGAAYGWPGLRAFGRLLGCYGLLNLLLAGALLLPGAHTNNGSIYLPLSPGALLAGAGGVYLAMQGLVRVAAPRGVCFPVEVVLCGTALRLRGYHDTGFAVREPVSGCGVVLVRYGAVATALPPELSAYLAAAFAGGQALPPSGLGVRLVPCDTVAGHCLLPAVPAMVRIRGQTRSGLYAAFAAVPAPPTGWEVLIGLE